MSTEVYLQEWGLLSPYNWWSVCPNRKKIFNSGFFQVNVSVSLATGDWIVRFPVIVGIMVLPAPTPVTVMKPTQWDVIPSWGNVSADLVGKVKVYIHK